MILDILNYFKTSFILNSKKGQLGTVKGIIMMVVIIVVLTSLVILFKKWIFSGAANTSSQIGAQSGVR